MMNARSAASHAPGRCRTYERITGFVHRDADAYAIYRAALHGHDDDREAWIDVTLDNNWDDEAQAGRVSMACRSGRSALQTRAERQKRMGRRSDARDGL